MNKKQRMKLYNEAEKYWGHIAQYDQCIEESGELIVAINKYKRKVLHGEYAGDERIEDNLIEEFLKLEKIDKIYLYRLINKIEIDKDKKIYIYFNFSKLNSMKENLEEFI